jgi:hypothetical protein
VGICNRGERWKIVLGCIKMLNHELNSAVLLSDYGVVAIFVALDGANQMPNMAERPFGAFFDCYNSLSIVSVSEVLFALRGYHGTNVFSASSTLKKKAELV